MPFGYRARQLQLQFLLFMQHGHILMAEGLATSRADIEPLVLVLQLTKQKVQVADATTCGMRLTGNLAIAFEEFVQRLHHLFEVKYTRRNQAFCI